MRLEQMSFDLRPPRARARRTDPATSRDAARSMRHAATAQAAAVLNALRQGPAGATEIARRCGLTQVQVCRRLSDLQKPGLAKPTGDRAPTAAGRSERVWRAV